MLKYLKLGISALAISALFLAPAVTVTLITADAAYANNGNGNGNGGGNRGGGNGGGAGKGGDKGARGDSNKNAKGNKGFGIFKGKGNKGAKNKSASKGGFGKGLKDFGNSFKNDVGKLFGAKPKKKATTKSVSRPVKSSKTPKARSSAAEFAQRKGTMHPSNLGKLNGAINSSPRAKQAHIENGQFMKGSGPVSLAAALAVADYNKTEVVDAVHTLELADAFETIANTDETQLMNAEQAIKDYNQFIKDNPDTDVPEDLQTDYDTAVEVLDDVADAQEKIDAAAEDNVTTAPSMAETDMAEEVIDDFLEDYPEGTDPVDAAHELVEDAEDNLLAHYKGDLPDSENSEEQRLSDEEQEVVDTVRDNNPDAETVGEALDTYEARKGTEEYDESEEGDMAGGEDGEPTEGETDSAMVEETLSEG